MTVVEFLHRKNKILFDLTGVTLVPESQIQECEQLPLGTEYDGECCPYCVAFFDGDDAFSDECDGCPMKNDDNRCSHSESTYRDVINRIPNRDVINRIPNIHELQGIKNLVAEYNDGL